MSYYSFFLVELQDSGWFPGLLPAATNFFLHTSYTCCKLVDLQDDSGWWTGDIPLVVMYMIHSIWKFKMRPITLRHHHFLSFWFDSSKWSAKQARRSDATIIGRALNIDFFILTNNRADSIHSQILFCSHGLQNDGKISCWHWSNPKAVDLIRRLISSVRN